MFLKLFAATILSVLFFAQDILAQEPNCARNYTVQQNDTCNLISANQNVSTFQLAFVNADTINAGCTNLFEGESLCLGIIGQDCNIVHVVVANDTCEIIDDEASILLSTLLNNNPNINSDCTNIGIGEVLCTDSQLFNYTNSTTS